MPSASAQFQILSPRVEALEVCTRALKVGGFSVLYADPVEFHISAVYRRLAAGDLWVTLIEDQANVTTVYAAAKSGYHLWNIGATQRMLVRFKAAVIDAREVVH